MSKQRGCPKGQAPFSCFSVWLSSPLSANIQYPESFLWCSFFIVSSPLETSPDNRPPIPIDRTTARRTHDHNPCSYPCRSHGPGRRSRPWLVNGRGPAVRLGGIAPKGQPRLRHDQPLTKINYSFILALWQNVPRTEKKPAERFTTRAFTQFHTNSPQTIYPPTNHNYDNTPNPKAQPRSRPHHPSTTPQFPQHIIPLMLDRKKPGKAGLLLTIRIE